MVDYFNGPWLADSVKETVTRIARGKVSEFQAYIDKLQAATDAKEQKFVQLRKELAADNRLLDALRVYHQRLQRLIPKETT